MDPGFNWRLKAALDRVTPPSSSPRYQTQVMGSARTLPLGPALLAAGATMVLLAVTATAATGSPNPVVWAERAGATIQSVGHAPVEAAPSPEPSPEQPAQKAQSAPAAPANPTHDPQHEAQQTPGPQDSPDPSQQAEPSDPPIQSGNSSGQRLSPTPPPS
jgi:hypothetical protein